MSIAATTDDQLKDRRQKSLNQERAIHKEDLYRKWRKSDATNPYTVTRMVGIIAFHVVALWSLLLGGITFAIGIFLIVMKVLATIFSPSEKKPS